MKRLLLVPLFAIFALHAVDEITHQHRLEFINHIREAKAVQDFLINGLFSEGTITPEKQSTALMMLNIIKQKTIVQKKQADTMQFMKIVQELNTIELRCEELTRALTNDKQQAFLPDLLVL